jgi:hypothetical protein
MRRHLKSGLVWLSLEILIHAAFSAFAQGIIYSDLESGIVDVAYFVGTRNPLSDSWYALPWLGPTQSNGDFLTSINNAVFVGGINVSTAPGIDNTITVSLEQGGYASPSGDIIGSASATVNNGLTSLVFSSPIELDPGNDYWIVFTAPNLADNDYSIDSCNTGGRIYEAEFNYYTIQNLPAFDVVAAPEPTAIELTSLGFSLLFLTHKLHHHKPLKSFT